jgi:hypothetical protein
VFVDSQGTPLKIGDKVVVAKSELKYTSLKKQSGWIVIGFLEQETVTEVIVRQGREEIDFPLITVTRE